jgi:hypothetical protein
MMPTARRITLKMMTSLKNWFAQGDEMIEEAIKLRLHASHDEVAMKQLEETVTILAEHFKTEVNIT